ncbi:MAG: hypothetical protein ABI211_19895 [Vicinamibacterales bacterium]
MRPAARSRARAALVPLAWSFSLFAALAQAQPPEAVAGVIHGRERALAAAMHARNAADLERLLAAGYVLLDAPTSTAPRGSATP